MRHLHLPLKKNNQYILMVIMARRLAIYGARPPIFQMQPLLTRWPIRLKPHYILYWFQITDVVSTVFLQPY